MKSQQLVRLVKKLGLFTLMFFAIPTDLVEAQIVPDESLPTSVEQLLETMKINGEERAGKNLFHSFKEFSIPEGMEAVFENATDIENIFTRITGESISNIEGVLRTQGDANFFLINPNGIVFGENAKIDVGGSFVGTTANSIQFEGGTEFAASDSATESVITIERPIGLGFGSNPGAIQVNGKGGSINRSSDIISQSAPFNRDSDTTGLSVKSGNTLALVGGNLSIKGGSLAANIGRIELGSVNSGEVNLDSTSDGWTLDAQTTSSFGNIELSENSSVDVSGSEKGSISLVGGNISLEDGSVLLGQSTSNISSGLFKINASGSLIISGVAEDKTPSGIVTETLNDGKAADILVSAQELQLKDSGAILSSTFGSGDTGSLTINVQNLAQLSRDFQKSPETLPTSITTNSFATGDAGDILLSVNRFFASNGSRVLSTTLSSGDTGSVSVNANSIEIDGTTEADTLFGFIGSSTLNSGNSGNVNISTSSLRLFNGAAVSSDSIANGTAGNVTIDASESVEINGSDPNTNTESKVTSAVNVEENETVRGFLGISSVPNGDAGTVAINTPLLNVNEGGEISVRNQGTGDGGTLTINADNLNLKQTGDITAATSSGTGGNININTDSLQLDENSSITATAENDGNGGNVTINTTSLLAKKNSEITANAFAGTGGNIQIDTQGLFRFPDSTIEASSELGIDGRVEINTLDTNLQRDLELSELNLVTSEESLANSCLARRNEQQGSFVINNGSNLSTVSESDFYDSGSITGMENSLDTSSVKQPSIIQAESSNSMIPAQQAVKTPDGRIFLVSAPKTVKSLICN